MRIIFYPVIKSIETLTDLYHRACWYLPDFKDHEVVFPVLTIPQQPLSAPADFGNCGEPGFIPEFKVVRDNPEVQNLLSTADFILKWDDQLNKMEEYNLGCLEKYILNVSKKSESSRHEAYHFAILAHELLPAEKRESIFSDMRTRFMEKISSLTKNKAYVFGTGPSLELAMGMDFSDGISIISNTIVTNKALVDHIRPDVITAGDPALHYGVSKYACEFRRSLLRVMKEHECILIMPMGYYPLFVKRYPDMASRTFGVPIIPAKEENISLDLGQRYEAACYANVLTMLLLPVACTFSKNISIIGCDGRPPEVKAQNTKGPSPFWSHHRISEQEAIYDTLKSCHPSFFKLNYQDWYEDHCQAIHTILKRGEKDGIAFISATPSYVPALAERYSGEKYSTNQKNETMHEDAFEFIRDTRSREKYKISLIVSIYNADQYITPALENILNQTAYIRNEMEVILIDSASPGNEVGVINYYMDHHEHIFYGRTWQRETVYGAFNRAIAKSSGIYIMNLDTDNRLRNDAVDIFSAYLDNHPDIGLVYGNQYVSQHPNDNFYNSVRFGHLRRPKFHHSMMLHKFYFGSELMWRRKLHDQVGLYDATYTVAADYEMVCRFATVTKFAHVDKFYGIYMKNLNGVEYTNLKLCNEEDDRIRTQYKKKFPAPVDPPRVHIHYPVNPESVDDYLTIICHTESYNKDIGPAINIIADRLEFPHIIYSIDQNSSQTTKNSIAYLTGEGLISSGNNLLPHVREMFNNTLSYQPAIHFYLLAHGKICALPSGFESMKRPSLTKCLKNLHLKLTKDLRDENGKIDPIKVPTYCDHNELMRIDLGPHQSVSLHGNFNHLKKKATVFIQHYAPESQRDLYRNALKRCIKSIRDQSDSDKVNIVITDDGSEWSKGLLPENAGYEIHAYDKKSLDQFNIFNDIDVDAYLYKKRTGYFSKGIMWNGALSLTQSENLIFMDDDHYFEHQDCLTLYFQYLNTYSLVIGNTRTYKFRDNDGINHMINLGYDSPVVQGSNFGIHRTLMEKVGGFDSSTFLWGTGDDPALFWKLYLSLRPTDKDRIMKACYVDDILTHNPYSGRWREDCRLSLELFIRDFMRLYGVHPNSNPSRNRKTWVTHVPACKTADTPIEQSPDVPTSDDLLSIVVPVSQEDPRTVKRTVATLLEQNTTASLDIHLIVDKNRQDVMRNALPNNVIVTAVEDRSTGEKVRYGFELSSARFKGWVMPGALVPPKVFQASISAMADKRGDFVSGGSCGVTNDTFHLNQKNPSALTPDAQFTWAGSWRIGQPVFMTEKVAETISHRVDMKDSLWDIQFMLKAFRHFTHFSSHLVFSIEPDVLESKLYRNRIAHLIRAQAMPLEMDGMISKIIESGHLNGEENAPDLKWQGLPWYQAFLRRETVINGLLSRLDQKGIDRVALFGAGSHTQMLVTAYWPEHIKIICILDDKKSGFSIHGIPVINPTKDYEKKYSAVVLSSKQYEKSMRRRCVELGLGPVFGIYENI